MGASLLRYSLGWETSRTHDRYRSCQRYRSQPGGCIERSRSSEAALNHQPLAALPRNAENVWSALSGLCRKRAENRPIGISASQSISHSRNLRAAPYQTDHSTMGEISTLSGGIEGCRGVVSGTTQERSEEGETVSRSYDRQDPPHHDAWSSSTGSDAISSLASRKAIP